MSASFREVETSEVKDPTLRAAVNRLCSRAPSEIAASISWARAVQRVSGAEDGLDRRREVFGDALVQRRPNEFCLGRKPPVKGALTDTGATGDRLDGRVGPEFAVDLPRGFQDPLGVTRGICA